MANITYLTGLGQTYPTIQAALAAVPNATASSGNSYDIALTRDAVFDLGTTTLTITGKTTDASHGIRIRPATGSDYRTVSGAVNNAFCYDTSKGAAIRFTGSYASAISINNSYVTIEGVQISHAGGGNSGNVVSVDPSAAGVMIDACVIDVLPDGNYVFGISGGSAIIRNTLVFLRGTQGNGIDFALGNGGRAENCTLVRASNYPASNTGVGSANGSAFVTNCALFGFTTPISGLLAGNCTTNATDAATLTGTGLTGLVYANQFTSTTLAAPDFRTKAGSALINAGTAPATSNVRAPVGSRQQGTSADIGAWEFPDAVQAPVATVTNISITGQTVVISGTTEGNPTSGLISLSKSVTAYNSAVATGQVALGLSPGAFSATFNNLAVGSYSVNITSSNGTYFGVPGTNPLGDFSITGSLATSVTQVLDGQVLTINGNTSGNPTSATLIVPAAATNPNGATDQTVNITLGPGTFNVSATLVAGNYDPGVLLFTNAAGTSLPQSGTSAVSIISIGGNPQAPDAATPATPDTTPPVMQGTLSVYGQTSSGFTVSWQAATDNIAVLGYECSLDGGVTYSDNGTSLSKTYTGLASSHTYTPNVRAYDTSGNRSTPLTTAATTLDAIAPPPSPPPPPTTVVGFIPSAARTIQVLATAPNFSAGKWWDMTNPQQPRGKKDPSSTIDITFDWRTWLADMNNPSIAAVLFTLNGVVAAGSYASGSQATIFVAGGTGNSATVSCKITTDSTPPRVDERTIYLNLADE